MLLNAKGEYTLTLTEFFARHPKAAIAFSGGVDSAYLLCAALRAGADVRAYYVNSAFQPRFEREDAERLAAQLGAQMTVLPLDVLADAQVCANPPERCYHCKRRVFGAIRDAAARDGYPVLLDGTNASDDPGDRPGVRALRELEVLSPLRDCGLTKADVRRLSREAGLFTWDKPAYACLATRIPHGTPITAAALERTEAAEEYLKALGFTDFRVRTRGEDAKLEVRGEQLPLLLEKRGEILTELKKHYSAVLLDLEVRHGQ